MIVYAPNQSPFVNHGNLAMVLDLPHNLVRIIQPPVGGSFGGKDDLIYETSAQVAKLALVSGQPVRMTFSREESMIASYKRDAMRMRIRLGADRDGTLRACKFEGTLDSGAYASEATFTAWRASIHAMGAYRYDACHVDIDCVYTNNGYSGAFRGFGNTEVCSAIEQAIDEMAYAVGMDPMDFRLKNCLHVGDETAHGQLLTESVGLPECLKTARRISDWDRKRAEYDRQHQAGAGNGSIRRGIGMAALYHGTSMGAEGADYASSTISIQQNYSVDLTSGLTDYGTGLAHRLHPDRGRGAGGAAPTASSCSGPTPTRPSNPARRSPAARRCWAGTRRASPRGNLRQTLDYAAADLLGCELHQLIRARRGVCRPDRGAGELGEGGRSRPRDGPGPLGARQVDRADDRLGSPPRPRHALHGLSLRHPGGRGRGGHAHRQRPGDRLLGRARSRQGDLPAGRVRPALRRHRPGPGLRADGADDLRRTAICRRPTSSRT